MQDTLANEYIGSAADDAHVTVVGHSWGGDAAFKALQFRRRVNVLISIDPVARMPIPWGMIRPHCLQWLNVRAQPDIKHLDISDAIAWIGAKYPSPPSPGQPNAPD